MAVDDSSLPSASRRGSGVSELDELSAAADRTAKKRVQNRVAQRTYRKHSHAEPGGSRMS